MIITCPHCRTQYQVTFEAIGSAGRKVQCAQCRQAWQQQALPEAEPETVPHADPDQFEVFEGLVEDGLDEAMEAEARVVAAENLAEAPQPEAATPASPPAKLDKNALRNQQRDFSRRRRSMEAGLPLARMRRTVRIGAFLLLAGFIATAFLAREQVVRRFPDLAGVYEAVGLGVNVIGLEFTGVTTLHSLKDGKDLLTVSAQIIGTTAQPRVVPPVVVSLLDAEGASIYEWSVTPAVRDLMAGERASFDTQLITPPSTAQRVRLSFAGGDGAGREPAQAAASTALAAAGITPPSPAELPPTQHSQTEHH